MGDEATTETTNSTTTQAASSDTAAATAATQSGADGAAADAAGGADGLDAPNLLAADPAKPDDAAKPEGEADAAKGDADKPADKPPAPLTGEVPEKYEVKPPEGMTLDTEAMTMFDGVFRQLKLTNEGAQALVDVAPQFIERIRGQVANGVVGEVMSARKAWSDAAQADPEIGGSKFEETKAIAAKVFDRFGLAPEGPFRTMLQESGLGNHPDMLRVFAKIGRAIGEDGFGRGEATKTDIPVWDRVYCAPVQPG